MAKKRVDIEGLYNWIIDEIKEAESQGRIVENSGDSIILPAKFFNYNNDKVFSQAIYMTFYVNQNKSLGFGADPEWDDISAFEMKDLFSVDIVANSLFITLDFLFKRELLLETYKKNIINDGYDIHLLNTELFSIKEEDKLMKINYTYSDVYSDLEKAINKKIELNKKESKKNILYQKRNEIKELFAWEEGTTYPERIEIDISDYLTFKIDLDELKHGDKITISDNSFIVDKVDMIDKQPIPGNITEYGVEIKEASSFGQLHLFAEPDNFNYILDFYKTNRKSKGHHLFYCEALYETQDYIFDMTRGMPEDDRPLTQETEDISSILAYDPKDFEGFYGDQISEGKSIAEQAGRAFVTEFKNKISELDEDFDVREWTDQFILENFEIDLSNSFLLVQEEEYQQPTKKMKM